MKSISMNMRASRDAPRIHMPSPHLPSQSRQPPATLNLHLQPPAGDQATVCCCWGPGMLVSHRVMGRVTRPAHIKRMRNWKFNCFWTDAAAGLQWHEQIGLVARSL